MPRNKERAVKAVNRPARAAALPAGARKRRSDLVDEQSWNASRIRLLFAYSHIPSNLIHEVLDLAFAKTSQCVSFLGKLEDSKKIDLLVTTYIRHTFTDYQSLEASFGENNKRHVSKRLAIAAVSDRVEQVADNWRNGFSSNADIPETQGGVGNTPSTVYEEVLDTARSRKPQLTPRHSKAIEGAHDPRKVSKRKAPFYNGRNAKKLELAFARMNLTSIWQSNANDVNMENTQIEAPPETRLADLVAETSALRLHDTGIASEDDIQIPHSYFDLQFSSDATISDLDADYQEPSKRGLGSSAMVPKRKKQQRQYFQLEAIKAAEMSLHAVIQEALPDAKRIAKATARLEHARACLAKHTLRKQREQRRQREQQKEASKAAWKATMSGMLARAPAANANHQYLI